LFRKFDLSLLLTSAAAALLILTFPGAAQAQDLGDHDIIAFKKTPEALEKLGPLQLDWLMERDGLIYAVVGVRDLLRLSQALIPFTIETLNFPPYSDQMMAVRGGVNGEFHSYREVEEELMRLEVSYPALVKVYDIGDSLEGRNIYAVKLSDNVIQDENEAEVVFMGCHHAREWISVDVPLRTAQHLAAAYDADDAVRAMLDASEIWIIPIVNPDGLEYSIHVYRYWRKNRRDNLDGTFGVDLNRNYGYQWGYDDIGSSGDSASAVYRGPSDFSEPESRVIRDFVTARNFEALVSYHNYSQIILYPWGYIKQVSPQDELLQFLAANMVDRMARVHGRLYTYGPAGDSLYTTNGDTSDWALGAQGIPAFTIELPPPSVVEGGFFNAESDIVPIFEENLAAVLFLVDWAVKNYTGKAVKGPVDGIHPRSGIGNRREGRDSPAS
jgi:murein tripeptide amidase MpaA